MRWAHRGAHPRSPLYAPQRSRDGRRNGLPVSDIQEHPDWFRAHDGKWYPKDRLPGGDHVAAPEPPPDRRWIIVVAVAAGIAAAIVAFVALTGGDDEPDPVAVAPTPTGAAVEEPTTVLDEVFPDRPDGVTEGPTPDAEGAADAAASLRVVEAAWVRSAFDDLDFVVVIRNEAGVAFGNVNVDAIFIDASGDTLAREPFSYPLVPAGAEFVLSGLRPIDPDAVSEIRIESSARGTIPDAAPTLDVVDVAWDQDPAGTVTLTGSLRSTSPSEFVSVVGVLRDRNGAFLGTAFAFVDAVADTPSAFEAIGFPAGDVAQVEVYATG